MFNQRRKEAGGIWWTPVKLRRPFTLGAAILNWNQRKFKLVKRRELSPLVAVKFVHTVNWVSEGFIKYILALEYASIELGLYSLN